MLLYEPDLSEKPALDHRAACPKHGLLGYYENQLRANEARWTHNDTYHK